MSPSSHPWTLTIVRANVTLYALSYWMAQPVIPLVAGGAGALAQLQTLLSLFQVLGGLALGRAGDVFGSPLVSLQISQLAAALSPLATAMAVVAGGGSMRGAGTLLAVLCALPTMGLHTMQSAQAVVARTAAADARDASTAAAAGGGGGDGGASGGTSKLAGAMGSLSLAYAVGMVAGSSIGGVLATRFGNVPALVAAGIVALAAIPVNALTIGSSRFATGAGPTVAEMATPAAGGKSGKPAQKAPSSSSSAAAASAAAPGVLAMLCSARLAPVFATQFLLALSAGTYRAYLPWRLTTELGLDAQQLGFLQSFGAAVSTLAGALLAGPVTARVRPRLILLATCTTTFVCMALWPHCGSVSSLVAVVVAPLSAVAGIGYTVLSAETARAARGSNFESTAVATGHAVRAAAGIAAPSAAFFAFESAGVRGVGGIAAALALAAALPMLAVKAAKVD
jgi:hypothetical protein